MFSTIIYSRHLMLQLYYYCSMHSQASAFTQNPFRTDLLRVLLQPELFARGMCMCTKFYLNLHALVTRAKARVINSLRCFFFAQDLVSHTANSDFDQSLQIVDACGYLQLCYWQFSSRISSSSHSTSCYSLALQVNSALSVRQ